MNFIDELTWRGMIQDLMPGVKEQLEKEMTSAYVGIDPTADSLHIGHLVSVMMLRHFQRCGHRPIVLVGGATGMIGDPSGKSNERNLLDEPTLRHNQNAIKNQLSSLIDFDSNEPNAAKMVNNFDWMSKWSFLDFIRDIGKLITVNYMMSKDSVKKRFSGEGEGMSFTEFTYQLVQGYDFTFLYEAENCKLQMGGSDQWGNITTGTELIRRKLGKEAFGLTCPLIKKADGTKFGKTEKGNIWLDARYTSPYRFYQFWLSTSDNDAQSYIKIFTFLDQSTVEELVARHAENPHLRELQKRLAQEITVAIHGQAEFEKAVAASEILFGGNPIESMTKVDDATIADVFDGVPQGEISQSDVAQFGFAQLCVDSANFFASKGELRRLIQGGGISVNGVKVENVDMPLSEIELISGKYILVQKGKKNFMLVTVK